MSLYWGLCRNHHRYIELLKVTAFWGKFLHIYHTIWRGTVTFKLIRQTLFSDHNTCLIVAHASESVLRMFARVSSNGRLNVRKVLKAWSCKCSRSRTDYGTCSPRYVPVVLSLYSPIPTIQQQPQCESCGCVYPFLRSPLCGGCKNSNNDGKQMFVLIELPPQANVKLSFEWIIRISQ